MKKSLAIITLLLTLSFSNDLISNHGIKPDKTINLNGIDKNHNLIRDDIEAYLKKTYNQPDDEKYRIALSNINIIDYQLFEAFNMMDILEIDRLLTKRKKLELCMRSIFKAKTNIRNPDFALTKYKLLFLNTEKRKNAFNEIEAHYKNDDIFDPADPKTCAKSLIIVD